MTFKTFLVLLVLLAVGVVGYLRFQAQGDPGSYFNQGRRYSLGKSPLWRSLLGTHKVGDARGQYLADGEPIVVEVLASRGLEVNEEGLRQFASEVTRITGRKTSLVNVDVFDGSMVVDSQIPKLVESFRRHKQLGQPNIFVIYAGDFEGSEVTGPAKAFNEFGILVSNAKLKDLTSQYAQATRTYLAGVMLHQFGHQLGLSESTDKKCIMQQELEKPTRALVFAGSTLPDTYCDKELEQAATIRASVQ
jgi:hypothetical protein